jgi:RimJ/RimL family protein N-acetyltransferase
MKMTNVLGPAIPTLHTRRLILRAPVVADFGAYRDFVASDRSKYQGGPLSETGAWGMFCHEIACWTMFGHGGLMIDLKATGQCIGGVGINHGPLFPQKELGWQLYEGFEGHGYVTEAAAAMRDWAFVTLGLPTLVSYIDPSNTRSIAVAERLGAVIDVDAPRQDAADLVYRHRR